MRVVRTSLAIVALTSALVGPLAAAPATDDRLTLTFATCAGRYSAAMEHAWLMGRDGALHEARRAGMVSLVEATMGPGSGRIVLARRIEAKAALAVLLARASFGGDATVTRRAGMRANRLLAACDALLLG